MTTTQRFPPIAPEELARIGEGQIAYLREMSSEDLSRFYPGLPEAPPGLLLWALIGASGTPILITDDLASALKGAREQDLVPISLQ